MRSDCAGGGRRRHHSIEPYTTAASATRLGTLGLANTCRRWVFTVCGEMYSRLADEFFEQLPGVPDVLFGQVLCPAAIWPQSGLATP